MITNKHITKIIIAIAAAAVCLCLLAVMFSDKLTSAMGGSNVRMEYESRLFDTEKIIEINIIMDPEDWQDMLDTAINEEYRSCDVEINGETICNVAIRPKGNTSLSSVYNDPDNDRYSFKMEFDRYVDGQTCYGLDKLILNNNYADATNIKEALMYDMFRYIGADASLYNFAKISVNGEYWGVYLALEAVEDSFILRNYGTEKGNLYKPDSMDMGDKGNMPENFSGEKPEGMEDGESSGESTGESTGESRRESAEEAEGSENAGESAGESSGTENAGNPETAEMPDGAAPQGEFTMPDGAAPQGEFTMPDGAAPQGEFT
ncbi:MAG: CotH kinase family protein, partial [Parasporobacterium sp.]|nr:CotH kinase family protein [Parasporobacterium sp.]